MAQRAFGAAVLRIGAVVLAVGVGGYLVGRAHADAQHAEAEELPPRQAPLEDGEPRPAKAAEPTAASPLAIPVGTPAIAPPVAPEVPRGRPYLSTSKSLVIPSKTTRSLMDQLRKELENGKKTGKPKSVPPKGKKPARFLPSSKSGVMRR